MSWNRSLTHRSCVVVLCPCLRLQWQDADLTTSQRVEHLSLPRQRRRPFPRLQPPPPTARLQPAPQPSSSGEQQRVHDLIGQVEAAYARGDADYRKGMLAEAKVEFDRAVDLMLSSGIDIRGNQQLSDEFDHIVDQVNGLEMDALKQGNGFVPKEEITPAEAASDVTFAVDPNLVAKARAELATTKSDLP